MSDFLGARLSSKTPASTIARLELARDELRAVRPYGSISKLSAETIADTIDRAIAELRGEPVRYPALEAEHAASAAE
jgi:hypothetical protein